MGHGGGAVRRDMTEGFGLSSWKDRDGEDCRRSRFGLGGESRGFCNGEAGAYKCLDFNGKVCTENRNVGDTYRKLEKAVTEVGGEPRECKARKGEVVQKGELITLVNMLLGAENEVEN